MSAHPALHIARKLLATVIAGFIAVTAMTGATAAASVADGDKGTVVTATKEYKSGSTVSTTRTKEW